MLLSLESIGCITFRFSFLKAGEFLCPFLARHCRLHWNFQLSPCVVDGFLKFTIFRIDETNASQSSSVIEFWLLVCPFLLFSLLSGLSNFGPCFRTHIFRSGSCWNLCQSPPGPRVSLWRFLFQESELCEFVPRI